MNKKSIGNLGETYAEKFLISQNYRIIAKNHYSRHGEIDLIVTNQNQLIFIEVKTRTTDTFGTPQDAITYIKRQRLIKTALHFLNTTTKKLPRIWRIDLITVKLFKSHKLKEITHYKNILDGA